MYILNISFRQRAVRRLQSSFLPYPPTQAVWPARRI